MAARRNDPDETSGNEADREIIQSRIVSAPRELVYKVWTDPQHVGQWWGPDGFTNTIHEMDVRPGGVWRFLMHGPDGTDWPNKIVFLEVVKPERLVYNHSGDEGDEVGSLAFHVTVTFDDLGDKTKVTMRSLFATKELRDQVIREFGALEGGQQTLARLDQYVQQQQSSAAGEVLITRLFDAPRELVFQAWTDPEGLLQWYAPHGCTIEYRRLEIRPGGEFLSCIHTPDGHQCWCKGVYHEIVAPERIVYNLLISDAAGNTIGPVEAGLDPDWPRETMVTVTFVDDQGKTRLTLRQTVAESIARRTGAHPSWLQMLDRLAERLAGTKN